MASRIGGVIEFKFPDKLSLSSQLEDLILTAQAYEIPFYLITKVETQLSGPLKDLVGQGMVLWIPTL
jgi:hypothetical protein